MTEETKQPMSECAALLNEFLTKVESLIDSYSEAFKHVDSTAMTLGEMEALSKRSDLIQDKFDMLGGQ